jgi:hypothetical protein
MTDLNLVSDFRWDPPQSLTSEIALMRKKGLWEPTTPDFRAVAGASSVLCSSFLEALGAILKRGKGSVDRLNIFTHGNPDLIAFKGRVQPGAFSSDVWFDRPAGDMTNMSRVSLATLRDPLKYFVVKGLVGHQTLADVRARFTAHAVIFIYSCKAGTDGGFLQDIANTFRVMVVNGFTVRIAYCPRFTDRTIDRKHFGVADTAYPCASPSVSDNYLWLPPYAAARGLMRSRRPVP